jgi:hypothetical protein
MSSVVASMLDPRTRGDGLTGSVRGSQLTKPAHRVSYFHDGNVRQALLIYLLAPPAVVASQVLCKWVRLLEPPRRWRRHRRRGS